MRQQELIGAGASIASAVWRRGTDVVAGTRRERSLLVVNGPEADSRVSGVEGTHQG
jgi:hypothetical protein